MRSTPADGVSEVGTSIKYSFENPYMRKIKQNRPSCAEGRGPRGPLFVSMRSHGHAVIDRSRGLFFIHVEASLPAVF